MAARRKPYPDGPEHGRLGRIEVVREAAPDMAMLEEQAEPEAAPEPEPLTHPGRPCTEHVYDGEGKLIVQMGVEWHQLRCGRGGPKQVPAYPTASNFSRIIQAVKEQYSSAATKYIAELVADTIHYDPKAMTEKPMNPAMRHGIETEREARAKYELDTGHDVRQVGFVVSGCGRFGCSPDGLIGEDGLLELKCPQPATHVEYLMERVLPNEYKAQVHGQLLVTGRKWVDFMSYAAMYPPFVIRVVPDAFTMKLRRLLERFAADYQATLNAFAGGM